MRRAQAHDGLVFIYGADNGIGALPRKLQILLQPVGHALHVLHAAEHPELMDGGDIHVENLAEPAHFQRLILQNRAQQLVDGDRAVRPAPDVDADPRHVRRLLEKRLAERLAVLDEQ